MDFAKVSAEIRPLSGKGAAHRARAAGKLPAVLYGHKTEPLSLALDPVMLIKALDKDRKRNTVFSLSVQSDGKTEDVTAMIRDVQIDPMSRQPVHVDFIRVSLDEQVKVTIPVVLLGIPVGVTDGGNLHQSYRNLPITAKPADIPTKIEMDVTALKIGDALHASDLKLPSGVKVMLDPKEALASVVAPRAEKVEEVAAGAVPVEGAAPAEGAAAAAPGAAPGAAPAAGAPAAAGAKGAPAAGAKGAPAAAAKAAPAGKKESEKKGK
jgi:large subunit ribosomal protein L25